MAQDQQPDAHNDPNTKPPRPPWYALDLRRLLLKRILPIVLIALVVISFSIVPLWRLCWYFPIYSARNFSPVADTRGQKQSAWRWVVGKEIRVYTLTPTNTHQAETIAQGVRALLRDSGLDFTVKVRPIPREVLDAYNASLLKTPVEGAERECVSFAKLESRLIELHAGDLHADILVVNRPIAECWWAHGMATFNSGLALLEEEYVSPQLGKHESCHLLGYQMHDDFPLYVLGYRGEAHPWNRDTLMMLLGNSDTLSERDFDALHYFWRSMEKRLNIPFLRK